MMPSQKFEELSEVLSLCQVWLGEVDHYDDPYVRATDNILMINGNREWETCFQVKERIEKMFPGANL